MTNLSREDFDKDEDRTQIVCFNILQIGELAKNISPEFVKQYNGVPWSKIKGMRDKVAHGYGTLDMDRIYNTAILDINPLKEYCLLILNKEE